MCGTNDHEYLRAWILSVSHHTGQVPIPEPVSGTRGMDSSDWLGLSHVIMSASLKIFGLNGRVWFSKRKSRYSSLGRENSNGGKDAGLERTTVAN